MPLVFKYDNRNIVTFKMYSEEVLSFKCDMRRLCKSTKSKIVSCEWFCEPQLTIVKQSFDDFSSLVFIKYNLLAYGNPPVGGTEYVVSAIIRDNVGRVMQPSAKIRVRTVFD